MSFKLKEGEYSDFVDYMVKAIREEEDVQNILKKIFAKKDENNISNGIHEYKKEKIQMEQKIEELQNKNTKIVEELEQYKANYNLEDANKTIIMNKIEKKLQQKETELQKEIEKGYNLNLKITKLENTNACLQEQIIKAQEKSNELRNRFRTEEDIFESYKSLSSSLRNSLSGIFRGSTVEEFIYCGVQKQNIELLWDAIRIRAIEENYDELEELNNIFYYFFYAYNKTFESPLYRLQIVEENEVFDNDRCLRTSTSNSSGKITKVIFKGYINNNNKKIERKTIVKI